MPVHTRAQKKRAADAGVYSRTQQSAKKKKKKAAQKRTEREGAPPEKEEAVRATEKARIRARRADMPEPARKEEYSKHAEYKRTRPEDKKEAAKTQDAVYRHTRRAEMTEAARATERAKQAEYLRTQRAEEARSDPAKREALRKGSHTCDIDAHLNYITGIGFYPERTELEELLEDLDQATTNAEGRWAQAQEYRAAMRDRMHRTRPCACCGNRVPEHTMHSGITEGTHEKFKQIVLMEMPLTAQHAQKRAQIFAEENRGVIENWRSRKFNDKFNAWYQQIRSKSNKFKHRENWSPYLMSLWIWAVVFYYELEHIKKEGEKAKPARPRPRAGRT